MSRETDLYSDVIYHSETRKWPSIAILLTTPHQGWGVVALGMRLIDLVAYVAGQRINRLGRIIAYRCWQDAGV